MKLNEIEHISVGGIKTACISRKEMVDVISIRTQEYRKNKARPLIIFSSNAHSVSLANTDKNFMEIMNCADINHADGQSVVSMSKWIKGPSIPERSATTDTIHDIPKFDSKVQNHFLLGGKQSIVEKCAQILSEDYPNFQIAGTQHGYFDKENCNDIITKINDTKPDILWVGFGKPSEQNWIIKNRDQLNVPVIISCGGCYNYVTGDYARAPKWMQNNGLEWLHRALTEPKKLLWRYLTTNPHSVWCVLKHKYKKTVQKNHES